MKISCLKRTEIFVPLSFKMKEKIREPLSLNLTSTKVYNEKIKDVLVSPKNEENGWTTFFTYFTFFFSCFVVPCTILNKSFFFYFFSFLFLLHSTTWLVLCDILSGGGKWFLPHLWAISLFFLLACLWFKVSLLSS